MRPLHPVSPSPLTHKAQSPIFRSSKREFLSTIDLKIAIGLETTNDEIRNKCLNKDFTLSDYLEAINKCRGVCKTITYLLIKPPFLSEGRAIQDIQESIVFLSNKNISNINVTAIAVQPNTLLEFLYNHNLYRPPWLWSIIEINSILKSSKYKSRVMITPINYDPVPLAYAKNCSICSSNLTNELMMCGSISWDEVHTKCNCQKKWEKLVKKKNDQPINVAIDKVHQQLIKRYGYTTNSRL